MAREEKNKLSVAREHLDGCRHRIAVATEVCRM